jgi:tetratricopeptide (TPR) repeat protein
VQREADALVSSLRDFIAQPDYPTLVLGCSDSDVVLPNRILFSLDQQDETACYLLFPEPCNAIAEYIEAVVATLNAQWEILNAELPARGMEPLPPWPLEVQDSRVTPKNRLMAALKHVGEHLPAPETIVWGLVPGELADLPGYKAMIAPLLIPNEVEPWMDRHRFILRDSKEAPAIIPDLLAAENDKVLVMELDFSNERVEQSLIETASDKAIPANDRMFAFFQLAAIDFAFKRYPQALEKYGVCFNFYQQEGNLPFQSLCLAGAGDTCREGGKPADALKFYQQGIGLSLDSGDKVSLRQGLHSAGSLCLTQQSYPDAEGYLKHASNVAGKLNDPYSKTQSMEQLGQAQWAQGKTKEAGETWTNARKLAVEHGDRERALSLYDRCIAMYRVAGMNREAAQLEREKADYVAGVAPPGASSGA